MSNNRVYFSMVLTALFWSGAFITGKIAIAEFPAFSLTFFRFLVALPFIFLLLYYRQPGERLPGKQQWLPIIGLGILGTFGYHALFFSCLQYTTAINSSLIGSTNPMVTALLAALFFHERITPLRALGIGISFLGVFLTVTNGDFATLTSLRFNTGDLLMLIAVLCFAAYSVLSRRVMEKYQISPLMLTAYTFLVCTLVALPFTIWENPAGYLPATSWKGWLSILYMAVFASFLGYLIQMIAIQKIGAPRTMIFVNLVPVLTIIESVIILGESAGWVKVLSCLIIIFGVYLTTRPYSPAEAGVSSPVPGTEERTA